MTTRTLVDTDSVQIVANKWLDDVRQYQQNVDTLWKHGTINAALANIGTSTQTTLIVTENTAVNANTDLTAYPNISWRFLGAGKLTPAVGVTLTLYSGDTIDCPPYQQCLDASSGTITFAKPGWVWPAWFGAIPGASASAGKTALQKLAAAFGSVGGGIHVPGYTIQSDDTIAFTGPVYIKGITENQSIFEFTADASQKHGFTFTRSHVLEYLQLKTSSDLTLNRTMYGARMDLDGVSVSGGGLSAKWNHVKVRGFNNGLYLDGGDAYNVSSVAFSDLDLQCAGPASSYIGSCLYVNRAKRVYGVNSVFDQNETGEHAIYCFGSKNIVLDGFEIRDATRGEAQAIKLVGNGVAPDDDQAYPTWSVRNMDIENTLNGVLCGTYGTETLEALTVENCKFLDVDSTPSILAPVYLSAAGSSSIRSLRVTNITHRNGGYQGVHISTGASATMGQVYVGHCNAYNWSTASAGTYTWVGTSGTGTFGPVTVEDINANGNSNGRSVLSDAGQATTISRVRYRDIIESNVTNSGRPIALAEADATPSMAIGNHFTQGNGSAQNITAYDHLEAGQVYTVRYTTGNTTLIDGTALQMAGSANYNPPANAMVTFRCDNGTDLYEISRSAN